MDISELDAFIKEIKRNDNFLQMVRGMLFYTGKPGENLDRLALVIIAKWVKGWLSGETVELKGRQWVELLAYVESVIKAGETPGRPMPEPLSF